jgi:DNA replication ATP-dependent helicase Dna2
VIYESFDDRSGVLVVSRDPYRSGGTIDPRRPLQLDPEAQSLTALALEAIGRLRAAASPASAVARSVLEGSAVRTSDPARRSRASGLAGSFLPCLDASQLEAFTEAFAASPVTLVQGPPGTGKTHVLARIASALAADGERVLVTAYTHRAVNHALRKVVSARRNSRWSRPASAPARTISVGAAWRWCRRCAGCPHERPVRASSARRLIRSEACMGVRGFDTIVVDEAAQVPVAYAACAMLCGTRFVLVGDHRQLGPIVQGRHPDPLALRSVFAHLAEAYAPHCFERRIG